MYFKKTRKFPHGCHITKIEFHTNKSITNWKQLIRNDSGTQLPWVGLISLFSGIGKDVEAIIMEKDKQRRATISKFCRIYFIDHDFLPDVTTMDVQLVFDKVKKGTSKPTKYTPTQLAAHLRHSSLSELPHQCARTFSQVQQQNPT